jgi:orotate phosphoribosyltransferase
VQKAVLSLLESRKGHFLMESGHHGDLWLNLELLFSRPHRVRPVAVELAKRLSRLDIESICSPLVEGAFVGLAVASELDIGFSYSERLAQTAQGGLFPAGYRIPDVLRSTVRNKRVAIVTDVINAGSAVRGTFADLEACGAVTIAIGALFVLGTAAFDFAADKKVVLEAAALQPNSLWTPQECPLCCSGAPLEDVAGFRTVLAAKELGRR